MSSPGALAESSQTSGETGIGPPPAVSVHRLWQRFDRTEVLRDVNFEVGRGEIFGFIGPNGAGKTTTIRVMTTLLAPTFGRVCIDGLDVTTRPSEVQRRVGYMPDHAGIYERLTVREYLTFFAETYAERGAHDRAKVEAVVSAVLELTDLGKLQDKLVPTMSKGMKQRLQLARTLLHDPHVLILDEPASDLDPRARIEMRDLICELRRMGKTIFLSSHILTELADVCTSVAILERGHVVAQGSISELGRSIDLANPNAATLRSEGAPALRLQTTRLRIKSTGVDEQTLRTTLAAAGAVSVHVTGATVLVQHPASDDVISEIVKSLVVAQVGVLGVEPERNELERIFLEVTQGDIQ
ncbi:MAG: ABC transporter ATP-binding protein [Polyangiaceae bacterium]